MDKRELGKWVSGFGMLMFGVGFILIIGAMPRNHASRPFGDRWEIAVPLMIVGAVVFIIGMRWEMSRRK